jgi:hypothetical protein
MPASHFDVKPMTGRPKFIVRHSTSTRAHRKIINQTFNQTILNSYFDIFVGRSNELIVNLKKNYVNCETNIFTRYCESTFKIICG